MPWEGRSSLLRLEGAGQTSPGTTPSPLVGYGHTEVRPLKLLRRGQSK